MARILLVGGGCRGRELARGLLAEGHAVRITTRADAGRQAIDAVGAEAWVGDPGRLATLRGVLDGVSVACWLLARAEGSGTELLALRTERLAFFLTQAIDSTVRGFVYERGARDPARDPALAAGERIARELCERNMIPLELLLADAAEPQEWLEAARGAIARLLDRA